MLIEYFCATVEINKLEKIIKNVNEIINSLNGDVVELITLSAFLENVLRNSNEDASGRVGHEKDVKALIEKADNLIKNYSVNNFNK